METTNEVTPPVVPPIPVVAQPAPTQPKKPFHQTVGFKVLLIAILSLALLIPTVFIDVLSSERKANASEAQREIASKWSLPQYVTGPVISIPYTVGKNKYVQYVLPKTLNVNADIKSQTLHRSIYEAVVYNSEIDIDGSFTFVNMMPEKVDSLVVMPESAKIKVGLTDLRGISDKISVDFGGKTYDLNDGGIDANIQSTSAIVDMEGNSLISYGDKESVALGKIDLSQYVDSTDVPFKMHISLKGSEALCFAPVGETTVIKVKGDCPNPSFNGSFLPAVRKIDKDGFTASWKVISINRPYPQSFNTDKSAEITESQIRVGMRVAVDNFQKTDRAIKYALLVIVLTFVAALFVELRTRRPINALQYLLIGLALVLFYSLLLSISEHMAFGLAYLIAAAMTVGLVTLYLVGVLKVKRQALMIGGLLAILYAYIYVLLNLETYALLVGSIGLFVILALIMYVSLNLTKKEIIPEE